MPIYVKKVRSEYLLSTVLCRRGLGLPPPRSGRPGTTTSAVAQAAATSGGRQYGGSSSRWPTTSPSSRPRAKPSAPNTYLESMACNERDAKRDRQKDLDELSRVLL
jgi:hypothetical protein